MVLVRIQVSTFSGRSSTRSAKLLSTSRLVKNATTLVSLVVSLILLSARRRETAIVTPVISAAHTLTVDPAF